MIFLWVAKVIFFQCAMGAMLGLDKGPTSASGFVLGPKKVFFGGLHLLLFCGLHDREGIVVGAGYGRQNKWKIGDWTLARKERWMGLLNNSTLERMLCYSS